MILNCNVKHQREEKRNILYERMRNLVTQQFTTFSFTVFITVIGISLFYNMKLTRLLTWKFMKHHKRFQ